MTIFDNTDGRFCLTIVDTDLPDWAEDVFDDRDLHGGGYSWRGILSVLIAEQFAADAARFTGLGAEADNACVYCDDRGLLERLAELFRETTHNRRRLTALLDRIGDEIE